MKLTKLIVIVTVLLLASQLFAQNVGGMTYVQKLAALAQSTGQPQRVMPTATPGHFRSFIWVAGGFTPGQPQTKPVNCNKTGTGGFCPPALEIAYGTVNIVGGNGGAGTTIAIVDAYHYANVEADLNFFSTDMGLPACTTQNGCFKDVDENGGTNYCGSNSNWELETMLDVEWAHAMAPNAKIVLVEGCDNSFGSLNTAVTTAVTKMGANFVSNSYGAPEFSGENAYDSVYNIPYPLLYASGDYGSSQTNYPCASPYVTCVGGTQLHLDSNFHRTSETGWSGSGGNCSPYEALPAYQSGNGVTLCSPHRATPDIAAIGGSTVYIYDSGNGGYGTVTGTSLATPLTAAVFADVEAARRTFKKADFQQMGAQLYNPYKLYGTAGSNYAYFYYDVLTGSNGHSAGPGFDLVTGLGVSNGAAMANPFFGLQ
jgi:subtilase family serine protease